MASRLRNDGQERPRGCGTAAATVGQMVAKHHGGDTYVLRNQIDGTAYPVHVTSDPALMLHDAPDDGGAGPGGGRPPRMPPCATTSIATFTVDGDDQPEVVASASAKFKEPE